MRGSCAPSSAHLTREWRPQWRAALISVNFCPANRLFGQQPSNPRAQVRLLPGPSWLFMGISSCDPGCVELRGAGARPLKTARDRLSTARTGAHPAQQRGTGTSARHSRPELTALGPQQQREICPTWAYSHSATSITTPRWRADLVTAVRRGALAERLAQASRRRARRACGLIVGGARVLAPSSVTRRSLPSPTGPTDAKKMTLTVARGRRRRTREAGARQPRFLSRNSVRRAAGRALLTAGQHSFGRNGGVTSLRRRRPLQTAPP